MNFDDVAFAGEAEPFGPDGQGAEEGDAPGHLVAGEVGVFMDDVAAEGVRIILEDAFEVDERGAAGAEEELVDGGERNGFTLSARCRPN
jgi:hypothetical protein